MKLKSKVMMAVLASAAISVTPVMAQTTIADVQKGAAKLADVMASSIPFNSTIGLNWSDAYIGQLIGLPPHFGFGVVGGATTIDAADISPVLTDLGYSGVSDLGAVVPLPAMAIEGRIGGFILPFDVGLKIGYIPTSVGDSISESAGGMILDYFLVGMDVRYALLKGNLLLPKISVGAGINYMKAGLGATVGGGQSFTFNDPLNNPHILAASNPEVGLEWETTTLDLKAQISKSLIIFTPYLGLGATYGMSKAGYYVKSKVTYDGNELTDGDIEEIKTSLKANGIEPPDISSSGISSMTDVTSFGLRAFGGFSADLLVLHLDFTGMYNILDGAYGGSVGLRFQL